MSGFGGLGDFVVTSLGGVVTQIGPAVRCTGSVKYR
jgi:hypothetical protein